MVNEQAVKGKGDIATSKAKADELAAVALRLGWNPAVEALGDTVVCMASRDGEVVTVSWEFGRCLPGSTYERAGVTVKLKNAAAAKRQMEVPAGQVTERSTKRARVVKISSDEADEDNRTRLPFDPVEDLDSVIIQAILGKRITWRKKSYTYKGMDPHDPARYQSAVVLAEWPQRHLQIVISPSGKRVLTFCAADGPFRSVYLDAIVGVR